MSSAQIPAHCPTCGAIFQSRFLSMFAGNIGRMGLSGNKETCPFCGNMANIADGVFSIADNIISVITAPNITMQMLSEFGAVVKEAYNEKTSPEDAASQADSIDPEFGKIIRSLSSKGAFYTTGLLLIYLATKSCTLNIELDANKLIDELKDNSPKSITTEQSVKK